MDQSKIPEKQSNDIENNSLQKVGDDIESATETTETASEETVIPEIPAILQHVPEDAANEDDGSNMNNDEHFDESDSVSADIAVNQESASSMEQTNGQISEDTLNENNIATEYSSEQSEIDPTDFSDENIDDDTYWVLDDDSRKSVDASVLSNIKRYISDKCESIRNASRKKKMTVIFSSLLTLLLMILVLTDIIPILPNAYHRSYVGRTYDLPETQNNTYDSYGDYILYAANDAILSFSPDMTRNFKFAGHSGTPYIRSAGNYALVYYKNTNYALVVNSDHAENKIHSQDDILCANINSSGNYVLVTAEPGYAACVTAYNNSGKELYKWHTNSNIVDATISPDGSHIAAATVQCSDTDISGKIVFFDTSNSSPLGETICQDNIITDLKYIQDNSIIAVGDIATLCYSSEGKQKWKIDYAKKFLKTYQVDDEGDIILAFNRYNSTLSESVIEIYNSSGDQIGSYNSKNNVRAISSNNDAVLLSLDKRTVLIDKDGDLMCEKHCNKDFEKAVLFENYNFGLTVFDLTAEILSVNH